MYSIAKLFRFSKFLKNLIKMVSKNSKTHFIIKNKKALFNYEIIKDYEAWIELTWYEVKSIRSWNVNFKWSFISIINFVPFIIKLHISPYKFISNKKLIDPVRDRKIFLHKKDIIFLLQKLKEKWNTLIPIEIYFKWNLIKLKIALAKWKKKYDKKEVIKKRDIQKDVQISLKERF